MEATRNRQLRNGSEYNHLFPRANENVHTIKRNASLDDTMKQIPKVVEKTLEQTKRLAAVLKRSSVRETCHNIWEFVYHHIQYKKDEQGYEQIRSPARAWHDRRQGVDCDCYTVFISTVLCNLGIPHLLRITKYRQAHYQHIYPVVLHDGHEIIMDCVTDRFDYEVPFSAKKDYPMDLQFLDGLPGLYKDENELRLLGTENDLGDLGKLLKKSMAIKKKVPPPVKAAAPAAVKKNLFQKVKAKIQAAPPPVPAATTPTPKPKKKGILKKVLNVVNKVNPATVLLRNGVLAAMKLNVKNVAGRLRWSYLTADKAAAKGIDAAKFQRLLATRQKLEKIFYGAGGKPDNLRKAILGGKGNKDKAVNGLGTLPAYDIEHLGLYTPIEQLLGPEIYHSENVEGFHGLNALHGLGELGEPVTLATVGAAMGVISGIVASLKQIGNIFKGKQPGSEDFDEAINQQAENNEPIKDSTPMPPPAEIPKLATPPFVSNTNAVLTVPVQEEPSFIPKQIAPDTDASGDAMQNEFDMPVAEQSLLPATTTPQLPAANLPAIPPTETPPQEKSKFWEANKKWLKPTLIAGGSIAVIAIGYSFFKSKNKSSTKHHGLSGFSKQKHKKKNHHRHQKRKHKVAVALL
jgi:hypothetical protein